MDYALILVVGLVAGTLSGIVGFGSSLMLMPVLVIAFDPVRAVPIMAIAAIMANVSRVAVWWREVDWRLAGAFAATGAPAAAAGAYALLSLPARAVEIGLGVFFISMIWIRRWMAARNLKLRPVHLSLLGAPIGFVTGVAVSTGPITAPIYLATGLVKGAFVATEAAATLTLYFAKTVMFRTFGALTLDILLKGLLVGSTLMAGAWLAKRFVLQMEAAQFRLLMEGIMLASGLTLLGTAYFG
jgi:uncharacterized membrane protein YfcA